MPAPFPAGRRVPTNGIELVVHEAGEGPTVVLLHGFPELAYSWRHQVPKLVDAGFRVIAPDQRGYGASDAPADPVAYSMRTLVADVVGVLDALDVAEATVVGHDFGGMVAWLAAVYAPQRVRAVASLCTPHGPRGRTNVVESYRRRYGDAHYMTSFQAVGRAEGIFEADLDRTFTTMLRGVGVTLAEFRTLPADVQALPMGLFTGDPQLFGAPVASKADIEVYVDAYRQSGFRGPLSWYRSLPRTWEEAEGVDMTIDKPALLIQAADDWFLAPDQGDLTGQYATRLERRTVPDCAHWIQQEKPDDVNALLLAWLTNTVDRRRRRTTDAPRSSASPSRATIIGAMRSTVPDALVRAAEELFAERGSEAVSLREVVAAAGVSNASAVQYHFRDRSGLIRAVLAKHEPAVDRVRSELLDAYAAAGVDDMRKLASALVLPLAKELENADGGVGYLQLVADLYNRPNPTFDPQTFDESTQSIHRWRAMVMPLLTPEAVRLHRRFDALRFTVSELARRGRSGRRDHRLFTSQLTDLVTALLIAPVSDETHRLLSR